MKRERAEIECGEREKQRGGGVEIFSSKWNRGCFPNFSWEKQNTSVSSPPLSLPHSLFSLARSIFSSTHSRLSISFQYIGCLHLKHIPPSLSHSHSHDKIHVSPCLHFIIIFSVPFYGTDFFLVYGLRLVSGMSKQGRN